MTQEVRIHSLCSVTYLSSNVELRATPDAAMTYYCKVVVQVGAGLVGKYAKWTQRNRRKVRVNSAVAFHSWKQIWWVKNEVWCWTRNFSSRLSRKQLLMLMLAIWHSKKNTYIIYKDVNCIQIHNSSVTSLEKCRPTYWQWEIQMQLGHLHDEIV